MPSGSGTTLTNIIGTMQATSNFDYLSMINVLLTGLAIYLAWRAYKKTVSDQLIGWHTLLENFQKELAVHKKWLEGFPKIDKSGVPQDDKDWYNPIKLISPMTFLSGREILLRAYPPVKCLIPPDFFGTLAIFIQRVDTFNFLLSYLPGIYSANLEKGYDLDKIINPKDKSDTIGQQVEKFENRKNGEKVENESLLKIASSVHKLHLQIHHEILGNDEEYHLTYLAKNLNHTLEEVLKDWNCKIPWYL